MEFYEWWSKNSVELHESYSKSDMEWIAELAWKFQAARLAAVERERDELKKLVRQYLGCLDHLYPYFCDEQETALREAVGKR